MVNKMISKERLVRMLVVFKFTLLRGYSWCQLPTLALMGTGIMLPYVQQYGLKIRFWQLAVLTFAIFLFFGYLDRKLKLLHAENNYGVETNPLLMQGLRGELKLDGK